MSMDWPTAKEPTRIYGKKTHSFRSFTYAPPNNKDSDIDSSTFCIATKRKGIPVDNGKGLKKRPATPSTENKTDFFPILPGKPKSEDEIECILLAADPTDRMTLLSLLFRSDQAEMIPFLIDYPDRCDSRFHELLINLGFDEITLVNSTKMKYVHDKAILKKMLLKTTSTSDPSIDVSESCKFNLRVDIAARNNVYSLRSSVRSPRPEESPKDTRRCGSVETVQSDSSPCSTPLSFQSGSRPRSSSNTSNIVRVFQRLKTSTSPTEGIYSLGTTSLFERPDKESERGPSLPDLCGGGMEGVSVADESSLSRAYSMPQLPSPHGIYVDNPYRSSTSIPFSTGLDEDDAAVAMSPSDLPVPDFGVLSSIVMDSYVPCDPPTSPVSNCLLFEDDFSDEHRDVFSSAPMTGQKAEHSFSIPRGKQSQTCKTRLVRSQTDPGLPLKSEPATPCREHSQSQGDAPSTAYRTPSDCGRPKVYSGRTASRDWGKSTPSDKDDITDLRRSFNELINANGIARRSVIQKVATCDTPFSRMHLFESSEERARVKIRKSQAKWRRLSMGYRRHRSGGQCDAMHLFCNSGISSQSSFSLMRAARSPSMMTESDDDEPALVSMFSTATSLKASNSNFLSPLLNASNFRAVIIGGNYAAHFDDAHPVVTPAKRSERRIVALYKHITGVVYLKLFFPKEKTSRIVDLGTTWSCIRACPDGYLVSRCEIIANTPSICFFVTTHPDNAISPPGVLDVIISERSLLESYPHNGKNSCANTDTATATLNIDDSVIEQDKDDILFDVDDSISDMDSMLIDTDSSRYDINFALAQENDWNDTDIVARVLEYLPELGADKRSVSKLWAISYYRCKAAEIVSDTNDECVLSKTQFESAMRKYNSPLFLSAGASKSVFRVSSTTEDESLHHAVSIMDIDDLRKRDMDLCVKKELEVSLMCSVLSQLHICPNLLRIYSVFRSRHPPPRRSWKQPLKYDNTGTYQYIRMEYCSGGDLESLIRRKQVLDADITRFIMFQMCFALYTCRDILAMRHYDIKLLNFFCGDFQSLCNQRNRSSALSKFSINYVFDSFTFSIPSSDEILVKLADFGTSCIGTQTLSEPITIHQFTTLENTPPEFLFLGSSARESYTADTFALGLAWLHLLTGDAPYEELMSDIVCPAGLRKRLAALWMTTDPSSPYFLIGEVIRSVEIDYSMCEDAIDGTLFDTLYRYIVLFGLPVVKDASNVMSQRAMFNEDNPVWMAITDELGFLSNGERIMNRNGLGYPRRRVCSSRSLKSENSIIQFEKDCNTWSLKSGSHPVILRFHRRVQDIGPEALVLLEKLTHFDPSRRCTLHEALLGDLFLPMRQHANIDVHPANGGIYFTHYSSSTNVPTII